MSSKEDFCYKILKKYSMLVDFEGTPHSKSVLEPIPEDNETYKQWKKRVLGDAVSDVTLYGPIIDPAPQTRIKTLQYQVDADHLEKIFNSFAKAKEAQRKKAISTAVEKTEKRYESFSKETLEDILVSFDGSLEPSVSDFFNRFLNDKNPDIDTEKIIKELIEAYNNVVREYRNNCL